MSGTNADKELEEKLAEYLKYEQVEENRRYIEELSKDKDNRDELRFLICQRLSFGTAGIRGPMGPGYRQINDLVIIQISQGLASYLLDYFGVRACRKKGVLIGFDARHNSERFARLAAVAFLQKKIKVHVCEHVAPTPIIAYGVMRLNCLAGVMVTASHNPKNDNGYKIYWRNGAQITRPHDTDIERHIEANLKPWPAAWLGRTTTTFKELHTKYGDDLFMFVHDQVVELYFDYFRCRILRFPYDSEIYRILKKKKFPVVYTAMHGVGHEFLTRALHEAGFERIVGVEEQAEPDPEFPTVRLPNPEEHGALELAYASARRHSSMCLILALDPDADRCAASLCEWHSNTRRPLSGNEIGALLGWWMWQSNTIECLYPRGKTYMLSTVVSSRFLQSLARAESFKFRETLTGFKHIAAETEKIEIEGGRVLFAYEEAIGFMVDSELLDKDGISAGVQLARMASFLYQKFRRSLAVHLEWLYKMYGYHYTINSYYTCSKPDVIERIFRRLQADFPQNFGDEFPVSRVRDLNMGYDSGTKDKRPVLPTSSSSFMVTFFVCGTEIVFTLRTSGTEPKIKYYSEIMAQLYGNQDIVEGIASRARIKLASFVTRAIERCLQPVENKLTPAASNTDCKERDLRTL